MLLIPAPFIAFALFVLGAICASFVGVISERIHTGHSIFHGRSRCNSCSRLLGPLDLVPIVSWLVWQGKCRTCKAPVPGRYSLQEAILGCLFALSFYTLGISLLLPLFLSILLVLLFIVLYDLAHTIVPKGSSELLFLLCAAYAYLSSHSYALLGGTMLTAGCIGLGFLLLHVCSKGRAMGLGDTPISIALAFLVGFPQSLSGLTFSFWTGAIVGILILVLRRGGPRMGIEVPFVPFLAIGFLLAFFTQWNIFPLF